jgi:hypothetical protein
MRGKFRALRIPLFVTLALYSAALGQPQAPRATPPKLDAYVIPFSHLDLFWAGTREECLARGNRIIAPALRIARDHPEFRFAARGRRQAEREAKRGLGH